MQAIILAGGRGERLSPFTNTRPKGMLEIEGKPILEYQIEWLKKHNVKRVVFACGYLSEVIKNYFGDGRKYSLEIDYSIEEKPLGRGGALKKAWEKIAPSGLVIAMNGDIYTEMDLSRVISAHNESKARGTIATICIFPYKSPYGIVRVKDDGLIEDFQEKRTLPYYVNGGIYVFEQEVKNYLPDVGDHETTTFIELARRKLMFGYKSQDYWRGIDTVKDLNEFTHEKKALLVK